MLLHASETSQTIIEELNKIKVEKLIGRYILRYALIAKQKQILSYFDLTQGDVVKLVKEINDTLNLKDTD